jgi:hypothetical protein
MAVDGGGAGAVVTDDGALALHRRGGERGEVGSRTTENGRGWRLTERVNDGGDAVEICRVVTL